jgi:hypothetical protein
LEIVPNGYVPSRRPLPQDSQITIRSGPITGVGATVTRATRCHHDPKWLDSPPATAEVGSIVGRHRHGWFLLLQILQHDIGPTPAQHVKNIAAIDALVGDQHESPVIAAHQSRKIHRAPSSPASSRTVTDIPQAATEPFSRVR